ncbi:MAG TPA: M1 family metallopeptidase [Edaphocola sp.]|nr:M1 family metallopeptidase [Edaphocola sp.]
MSIKYSVLLILLFNSHFLYAQKENYFQQKVDHTIEVSLDDKNHFLRGWMKMKYKNNSKDTLNFLYFHLYPNAYSADNTAFARQEVENKSTKFYLAPKSDWGFIDSLSFKQQGVMAKVVPTEEADIIRLILPEPILPGASTEITTPFRVKIPIMFSRLGHKGNSYQISQWFPKPAVYDHKGWHPYPYLNQGEFYSEYGSYDVSISLPENYIVMATGNLQTASEIKWLDQLAISNQGKDTLSIKKGTTPSSPNIKTIRYTEDNVHDFAWFADKDWKVEKDTILVPNTEKITEIFVAYKAGKENNSWNTAVKATKAAIKTYSELVGPYPYKTVKVVEGALTAGGGMEYPTVTVIAPGAGSSNDLVIIHEVGHNWFYGILGSNERMYPWMDEGINSYYEKIANKSLSKPAKDLMNNIANEIQEKAYSMTMSKHSGQAIGLPAAAYTASNYGLDVYGKAPAYLNWLAAYMGQENFNAAMNAYFEAWKFKHPQPEDFEAIFRQFSPKNLDWFFTDGLHSSKGVDFAVKKLSKQNGTSTITLKNKTGFNGPLALQIDNNPNPIWLAPFKGVAQLQVDSNIKTVNISSFIPDYKPQNNSNVKKFNVKPAFGLTPSNAYRMFIMPAIGYNVYDRFMLGAAFHNIQLNESNFQYTFIPMYSFKANTLVGTGTMSMVLYPESNWLQEVDINLEGKRFSYIRTFFEDKENPRQQYLKLAPELRLWLKKPQARSPIQQYISLKAYYIREGSFNYFSDSTTGTSWVERGAAQEKYYGRLRYSFENERTFNPYNFSVEAQQGQNFTKLSATANLKVDYFYKKKALYFRAFGGKMFSYDNGNYQDGRYAFSGTYSGWNDYLYDQTFIGRNMQSSLASQQIYEQEGGMKIPTLLYAQPIGLSNDWMFAFNFKADLPIGIPIQIFADFMTFADAKNINPAGSAWLYDAGLSLHLMGMADVYFPILMSTEYKDYQKSILGKNAFFKSITFKLDLDKIYWPRWQKKIINF